MRDPIKNKRLNLVLGRNDLREYLSGKIETGVVAGDAESPSLERVREPFGRPLRVMLIGPPITIPSGMSKRCIPPLGLCYIAANLEKHGIDVAMLDCTVEGYDTEREVVPGMMTYGLEPGEIAERIIAAQPDIIGLSVLFSTDLENLFETCRVIRSLQRDIVIVVGGLHPTIYPRDVVERSRVAGTDSYLLDVILRGEGEHRMVDFVKNWQEGVIDRAADGLVARFNGDWVVRPQRAVIDDLDDLPYPAYHLLPMDKYFEINVPFSPVPRGKRVVQILMSRGCPVSCTFCASTNMYKKYRHRSVANVVGEIRALQERYGADEVQFADDNLAFNRGHSEDLFQAMVPLGISWCTPNGTMVNTLSPRLLELMASSGLYQITLSLDSGSARTLKEIHHKPVDLLSVPELIATAKKFSVFTHGTLVVGMPGETLADIEEGFEYVKSLELTSVSTFIAAAIPGSELYHQVLDSGLITKQDAERINTTKSSIPLSAIPAQVLEQAVFTFQREYSALVKSRDPGLWRVKYARLLAKDEHFDRAHGGRLT